MGFKGISFVCMLFIYSEKLVHGLLFKQRGAVGESIFHLCLLNASSLHADLAKRLLKFYPKLINDIYMSDEYYGK